MCEALPPRARVGARAGARARAGVRAAVGVRAGLARGGAPAAAAEGEAVELLAESTVKARVALEPIVIRA